MQGQAGVFSKRRNDQTEDQGDAHKYSREHDLKPGAISLDTRTTRNRICFNKFQQLFYHFIWDLLK
uniref:Uncharacterized protein n=1 Tax=Anguilla anguilla TaxID=7936 RepID=A0A0E9QLY8_ANGAN